MRNGTTSFKGMKMRLAAATLVVSAVGSGALIATASAANAAVNNGLFYSSYEGSKGRDACASLETQINMLESQASADAGRAEQAAKDGNQADAQAFALKSAAEANRAGLLITVSNVAGCGLAHQTTSSNAGTGIVTAPTGAQPAPTPTTPSAGISVRVSSVGVLAR
jgi:hypothetical protein